MAKTLQEWAAQEGFDPQLWDTSLPEPPEPFWQGRNKSFGIYTLEDLSHLNSGEWLIDDVLPKGGYVFLHGKPQSGKSLVAIHWAMTLARTTSRPDWFGHLRYEGPYKVLYVIGEGQSGMADRIEAWKRTYMKKSDKHWNNVNFVPQALTLFNKDVDHPSENSEDLVQAVGELDYDVVILDTLWQMSAGMDENSAQDAGKFNTVVNMLKNKGATVVILHHNRRSDEEMRGSGSLEGTADTMINCKAIVKNSQLMSTEVYPSKKKDGNDWPQNPIKAVPERHIVRNDRRAITSLTLVQTLDPASDKLAAEEQRAVEFISKGEYTRTDLYTAMGIGAAKGKKIVDSLLEQEIVTGGEYGTPLSVVTEDAVERL